MSSQSLVCIYIPATKPAWADLIDMVRKDGQDRPLRIIDFITSHSDDKCNDFADLLLRDHNLVEGLHNDYKDKKAFVRAVLKKWTRTVSGAVSCTWKSLVRIMKGADLDEVTVQEIENNMQLHKGD